jgi:hypothetical protein
MVKFCKFKDGGCVKRFKPALAVSLVLLVCVQGWGKAKSERSICKKDMKQVSEYIEPKNVGVRGRLAVVRQNSILPIFGGFSAGALISGLVGLTLHKRSLKPFDDSLGSAMISDNDQLSYDELNSLYLMKHKSEKDNIKFFSSSDLSIVELEGHLKNGSFMEAGDQVAQVLASSEFILVLLCFNAQTRKKWVLKIYPENRQTSANAEAEAKADGFGAVNNAKISNVNVFAVRQKFQCGVPYPLYLIPDEEYQDSNILLRLLWAIIRAALEECIRLFDQGLIQIDMKVGNILFSRCGDKFTARIIDFDTVIPVNSGEQEISGTTTGYEAPELARITSDAKGSHAMPRCEVTEAMGVFGLGKTLLNLIDSNNRDEPHLQSLIASFSTKFDLTGSFAGSSNGNSLLSDGNAELKQDGQEIPEAVKTFLNCMTAEDPGQRRSFKELLEEILTQN